MVDRAFRLGITAIVVPIIAYAWCRGAALVARARLREFVA